MCDNLEIQISCEQKLRFYMFPNSSHVYRHGKRCVLDSQRFNINSCERVINIVSFMGTIFSHKTVYTTAG